MNQSRHHLSIPAAQLVEQLLAIARRWTDAASVCGDINEGTPEREAADRLLDGLDADFRSLAAQISDHDPVAQIVLHAVVAYVGADKDQKGRLVHLESQYDFERSSCQLIQAVLEFAGVRLEAAPAA